MSHLTFLHSAGVSSGSGVNFKEPLSAKLHTHQWEANWEALPAPTTHIGRLTLRLSNTILGLKLKMLDLRVTADQVSYTVFVLIERKLNIAQFSGKGRHPLH